MSDDPAYDIYDGYFNQFFFDYYNPVQILEQNINDGTDKRLNVAVKGAYEIIDGLILDAFYSIRSESFLRGQYYDKNSLWQQGMNWYGNGLAERRQDNSYSQLFETTARWNGDITSSVNLSALGGYSYQEFTNEGFHVSGGDFITDAFTYNNLSAALDFPNGIGYVDSYKNSNKLIAFFGRVNLNINSTWFLTASARYEGSSRFGANKKWGLFPAIGGGVELTNFIDISAFDKLKFRVSYGVTGNQPAESYMSLLRMGPQGNYFYNGEFFPGYVPVSNENEDLGCEKKSEIDIGFDFSFSGSKLFGSFDFYTRTSTDLLFQYYVPVPPNLYYWAWLNIGEIKNSGLELNITWKTIETGNFSWSMTIASSYYLKNELVSLSGTYNGTELTYGVRDIGYIVYPGSSGPGPIRSEEGQPIGQLYTRVYKEIDESGNLIFDDISGADGVPDGIIDYYDMQLVGNGLPDFELGFGNDFSYKRWDLNFFFRGVFGHDLLNTYRASYEVPNMIAYYNLPKTATDRRNPETGTLLNNSSGILSDYHVENASFVSLDNLSLGYSFNLPESSGFRNIRVWLAGNNLFYITAYKGADPNPRYADARYPEDFINPLAPGIDRKNTWVRTRSVSLGITLGF
jgi:iron complex outermembrane receptor protein